jgi:hypothetical protein
MKANKQKSTKSKQTTALKWGKWYDVMQSAM